jgi:hypothetical protein
VSIRCPDRFCVLICPALILSHCLYSLFLICHVLIHTLGNGDSHFLFGLICFISSPFLSFHFLLCVLAQRIVVLSRSHAFLPCQGWKHETFLRGRCNSSKKFVVSLFYYCVLPLLCGLYYHDSPLILCLGISSWIVSDSLMVSSQPIFPASLISRHRSSRTLLLRLFHRFTTPP